MSRPPSTLQGLNFDFAKLPDTAAACTPGSSAAGWFSDSDTALFPQSVPADSATLIAPPPYGRDTIHQLSPASPLSPRTQFEGEPYDYTSPEFMRILQELIPKEGDEISTISTSYISCMEPELQRTIAIVRPEFMQYEDVVLRAIFEAGFTTIQSRHIHMTPEQVSELYAKQYGKPDFPHLVISMSAGPLLVLSIADINAVKKWKNMITDNHSIQASWFFPISMRKRFGLKEEQMNALHASETYNDSLKENRYFVPDNILEPLIQTEREVWDYCGLYVNNTLMEGCVELVRKKPIEPILFLAEWLLLHNPYQPRYPDAIAVLPT